MKKGRVTSIDAVTIVCPCGGMCENEQGSTLIDISNSVLTCMDCGAECSIPASAFKVRARRPKQAMDDEEEHLEAQRQHWEERAAIERDYIQLY